MKKTLISILLAGSCLIGCSPTDNPEPAKKEEHQANAQAPQMISDILKDEEDIYCDSVGVSEKHNRAFKVYKVILEGKGSYGLIEPVGELEKSRVGEQGIMRIHQFRQYGTDEKGIVMGTWEPVYHLNDPYLNKLEQELKKKYDSGKVVLEVDQWIYKDSKPVQEKQEDKTE